MNLATADDQLAAGWQAYHAGELDAAETACSVLLASDEDHVGARFLAGLIDYQRGRMGASAEHLQHLLRLRPDYAEAHNNLGNALAAQGQLRKAEDAFRAALRRKPQYAEAMNNLGNVLRDQRKLEEAVSIYQQALSLRPEYADCHNNLGIALARLKRHAEAMVSYRQALKLRPAYAEPHNNLGIVLASERRFDEAVAEFRRAVELKPDYADALTNLGTALSDAGQPDEAIDAYASAVAVGPRSPGARIRLGTALARQGRLDEAIGHFSTAVEIDPADAEAHNNLGNALREVGRLDESVEHIHRAIELRPDYAEAHNNLGVALVKQRRIPDALGCYERALAARRDYPEARLNRALAWLTAGEFQRGWAEYEWRWRCPSFKELACPQPRWDGGLLDGKTLLLQAEQGLGDTFQFVRYAKLARERGGRVWLRAPRALHPLLGRTPGLDRLVAEEDPLPSFDCHAPLLSMPRLFATTVATIPSTEPYLFPDERLVATWRERLAHLTGLRVGIAWQGNRRFAADRHRSVALKCFLPLADVPQVGLVSLQQGAGTEQLQELPDGPTVNVLGDDVDRAAGAFMDTAAIIANLDLVITSDTALAHLAGGLGAPVWVVLPHAADWRWLLDRDDSPWYPSMRLFRQPRPGDWDSVFASVGDALRSTMASWAPGGAVLHSPHAARVWNSRGVAAAERGLLDEAISLFGRAIHYHPEYAEAHNNLGNALRTQNRFAEAVEHLDRALAIQPDYAEAHQNLGIVLMRQRRRVEAIASFRRAIDSKPAFTQAWTSLGLAQAELRLFADAEASFRRAAELDPRSARILNNLGNALSDQGKRTEAAECFEQALEIDPKYADAHNNLGNALRELGRPDEAIASFERALAARPDFAEGHNNLGIAWAGKGDYERAIACYREALRIWPDYPAAHNNLGIALGHRGKYTEAIECYQRALQLKPDYAEAFNNLGIVLSQQGDYQEAIERYHRAIELKPDYAEAFSNLGITLTECGRLDEALASYNEAIRLKEKYPDAYMNRALSFLVRGDFERGWREYEWRWKCKDFNPRPFKQPRWEGEPLEGRRIMLHAEQGLGDSFQFMRYARLVKSERGGRVIVWCPRNLIPLLSQCPYIDHLTVEGEALPEFDVHLPLLSLPKLFHTTLETIPRQVPYLYAKPELIDYWRRELSYIDAFKIGINWQGNPRYRGDRHRSVPLEKFAPLAEIPGVRLISLQKGFGTDQIARLAGRFSVTELGSHRDEVAGPFMDTAAILMNLDLVITSDTSLPHLAGGLGVRTWMALPWAADWRWLLKREDSPWYPTMRLFRQREQGNWDEVFERMARGARELLGGQRSGEIAVPTSQGALLDQIATLEVKLKHAAGDADWRLPRELARLVKIFDREASERPDLPDLRSELRAIHEAIWEAETELGDCERHDDYGPRFVRWCRILRQQQTRRREIGQMVDDSRDAPEDDRLLEELAIGRETALRA